VKAELFYTNDVIMSEEIAAAVPAPVAEVSDEKACTGCEASKKDLDQCVLVNGEASCGDVLEAYKKCMEALEGSA